VSSIKGKHNFIRQSFQLAGLKVVGAIIALLVNFMLARIFQAEDIGKYFVSLGLIIFVSQLATLGYEKWLVKNLSFGCDRQEKHEKISLCLFLVFLGSLVSYFFYQLVLIHIFSVDSKLNLIELYSVALFFLSMAIFQANSKAPIGLLIQYILQPLLFTLLVFFFSAPLIKLYLISIFISLAVSVIYLFLSGYLRLGKLNVIEITPSLKSTFPYFSVMLVGSLVTHLSLPFSSLWLDDPSLAVVGVIARLINVLYFAVTGTRTLLLPLFSRAIASDDSKEILLLSFWGRIFPTAVVGIGIIFFTVFGEQIMQLFGDVYIHYHYLLMLGSLFLLPAAYYGWNQSYLIANNNIKLINISSIIAAVLVFSLLFILTPLYGVWAAVLVIVGGKTIYSLLTAYFTYLVK